MKLYADDLLRTPLDQTQIDFENEGGETYICGNPPFTGAREQSKTQKEDLRHAMASFGGVNSIDYVCGWIWKAIKFGRAQDSSSAFVATSSLCQGQSVPLFWKTALEIAHIAFAYRPFKWRNSARDNAGVHCVIVGLCNSRPKEKTIYDLDSSIRASNISPYLINSENIIVSKIPAPLDGRPELVSGNQSIDGGHLVMSKDEMLRIIAVHPGSERYFRPLYGADDFVRSVPRYCVWVKGQEVEEASAILPLRERFDRVADYRRNAGEVARGLVDTPFRFRYIREAQRSMLIVPRTTSERREYLPIGLLTASEIVTDAIQVIYDSDIYALSILSSKLHLVWIATVCGKLETRYRYSNTLGWNTFPIPILTDKNKDDMTRCAEDILLAREAHFPATIADLYDPDNMPADLRAAHERNDEVLERIYIGRRFRNDTERLEKLFDLYTKMIALPGAGKRTAAKKKRARASA